MIYVASTLYQFYDRSAYIIAIMLHCVAHIDIVLMC